MPTPSATPPSTSCAPPTPGCTSRCARGGRPREAPPRRRLPGLRPRRSRASSSTCTTARGTAASRLPPRRATSRGPSSWAGAAPAEGPARSDRDSCSTWRGASTWESKCATTRATRGCTRRLCAAAAARAARRTTRCTAVGSASPMSSRPSAASGSTWPSCPSSSQGGQALRFSHRRLGPPPATRAPIGERAPATVRLEAAPRAAPTRSDQAPMCSRRRSASLGCGSTSPALWPRASLPSTGGGPSARCRTGEAIWLLSTSASSCIRVCPTCARPSSTTGWSAPGRTCSSSASRSAWTPRRAATSRTSSTTRASPTATAGS
mmetsp:Transcript_17393/g.41577  ORF Transcript_17393/g.41577 Transcript_17393/m.41577 type:complete len:321 (-) Transcript_17393:512-1474(-)